MYLTYIFSVNLSLLIWLWVQTKRTKKVRGRVLIFVLAPTVLTSLVTGSERKKIRCLVVLYLPSCFWTILALARNGLAGIPGFLSGIIPRRKNGRCWMKMVSTDTFVVRLPRKPTGWHRWYVAHLPTPWTSDLKGGLWSRYGVLGPGWHSSVNWVRVCEPKGHRFDSQSRAHA